MPRPIPHSLAESLPMPRGDGPETAEVFRVHDGVGLPGEQELTRMGRDGASREVGNFSWEVANETQQKTVRLFAEIIPALHVPELGDFIESGVDFSKLQAGYEAYAQAGIAPELVFAPVDLPLLIWVGAYGKLREWQDANNAGSSFRLQARTDGDGLYVAPPVADAWAELTGQAVLDTPGTSTIDSGRHWKALVVPTASREQQGLAVNTSYDLGKTGADLNAQSSVLGVTQVSPVESHMPIGTYLAVQAGHILENKPLLDSNTWTWNAGTFEHENRTKAPASYWHSGGGQVFVIFDRVGYSAGDIGARLPVWG